MPNVWALVSNFRVEHCYDNSLGKIHPLYDCKLLEFIRIYDIGFGSFDDLLQIRMKIHNVRISFSRK